MSWNKICILTNTGAESEGQKPPAEHFFKLWFFLVLFFEDQYYRDYRAKMKVINCVYKALISIGKTTKTTDVISRVYKALKSSV